MSSRVALRTLTFFTMLRQRGVVPTWKNIPDSQANQTRQYDISKKSRHLFEAESCRYVQITVPWLLREWKNWCDQSSLRKHWWQYCTVSWEYGRIGKSREKRKGIASQGDGVRGRMIMNKGPGTTPVKPDFRPESAKLSRKRRARWWRHQLRKSPKIKWYL